MKFTAWELLAIERCLEKGIKENMINRESGTELLERFRKEKPKKVRKWSGRNPNLLTSQ